MLLSGVGVTNVQLFQEVQERGVRTDMKGVGGERLRMLIYWSISGFTNIHKLVSPSNVVSQLHCTQRHSTMRQLDIEGV